MTNKKLTSILKQADAINTLDHYVCCLMHKPNDCSTVAEVLSFQQYNHITSVYWVKEGHKMGGPTTQLIPCVEKGTIGYFPNRSALIWNLDQDNRTGMSNRYNYITCPTVTTLAKNLSGLPINVTEKPPEVAAYFMGFNCTYGSSVLVIGSGSGGDVLGLCQAGYDVVAVEVDSEQFQSCQSRLHKIVSEQRVRIEEKKRVEQLELEKELAELAEGGEGEGAARLGGRGADDISCVSCGDPIEEEEEKAFCVGCGNKQEWHHKTCLNMEVQEDETIFVCDDCFQKDADVDVGGSSTF